jgi:tripartite-type tricarboxylate transporter receptor subunit TctC
MRTMRTLLAAASLIALVGTAVAQAPAYPIKTIKLVVPTPAGSPPDSLARVVIQHLKARLGGTIIIENRPGAGFTIGSKAVANAEPDGHTLLLMSNGLLFGLYPNPGYDPIESFAPVAMLSQWSHILAIRQDFPASTVQELVAYARANPGKVNFGFARSTPPHVLGETFKSVTGADIASVPFRGGMDALTEMLGGRIDMTFLPPGTILPVVQQGKVRALAYTGAQRSPELPGVPTIGESGFPQLTFNPDTWIGILAPARTPIEVINRLNGAINESLKSLELQASFAKLGLEPKILTLQEFSAFIVSQSEKWPPIIKAAGLQPE